MKRKVVVNGSAAVDPECTQMVNTSVVLCEGGGDVYDAMLNQASRILPRFS